MKAEPPSTTELMCPLADQEILLKGLFFPQSVSESAQISFWQLLYAKEPEFEDDFQFPQQIRRSAAVVRIDPGCGADVLFKMQGFPLELDCCFRLSIETPYAFNSSRWLARNTMDGRCKISLTMLLLLSHSFAMAQESSSASSERVTIPKSVPIGLLVLVDNQIVKGRCTPRPDGYDVEVAGGRMFIESQRIRFVAKDPDDAYLQMRRSQGVLTPDIHMQLARWCLDNNMKDYAELEVLDALRRDPNRADARRLLASLTRKDDGAGQSPSGFTEFTTPKRSAIEVESRSLAGLSRPVAQEFTRHVQPILMNKCATAGCHGPNAESTFQLSSTARGSSPVIAERNLAAVLKQVDLTRPSSSAFLIVLEKAHGGQPVSMFRGRAGSLQMKVLRDWVYSAANDIAPEANLELAERKAAVEAARRKSLLTAAREASESGNSVAVFQNTPGPASMSDNPHGRLRSIEETDQEFLEDAEKENAQDAFSPSAFNRKYHGRATAARHEESKPSASEDSPEIPNGDPQGSSEMTAEVDE